VFSSLITEHFANWMLLADHLREFYFVLSGPILKRLIERKRRSRTRNRVTAHTNPNGPICRDSEGIGLFSTDRGRQGRRRRCRRCSRRGGICTSTGCSCVASSRTKDSECAVLRCLKLSRDPVRGRVHPHLALPFVASGQVRRGQEPFCWQRALASPIP
jgi:hypothetical protein